MQGLEIKIRNMGCFVLGMLFIAGLALLWVLAFFGLAKIAQFLYPSINILSAALLVIFVFFILPLSLFKRLRPLMTVLSYIISAIYGLNIWLFAILALWTHFGWLTLLFLFLFHAFVPAALIILLFNGQWSASVFLILGLVLTYGIRMYALWLSSNCKKISSDEIPTAEIVEK